MAFILFLFVSQRGTMPYVKALKDHPDGGTHRLSKGGIYETTDSNAARLVELGVVVEVDNVKFREWQKKLTEPAKAAKREKRVLDS